MALTACPDCGVQVSDQAPTCPGCGRPISADQPSRFAAVLLILIVGVVVAVAVTAFLNAQV